MSPYNSLNVKVSSLNVMPMFPSKKVYFNRHMRSSREEIAFRLRLLPDILGKDSIREMLEPIDCTEQSWSNYKKPGGDRTIPWEVASDLEEVYDISLDWIYLGKLSKLPEPLRLKVKAAERKELGKNTPGKGIKAMIGLLALAMAASWPTPWAWDMAKAAPHTHACPSYGLYRPNATLCRVVGIHTQSDAAEAMDPLSSQSVGAWSTVP